jgi:hypothetical protein
LFKTVEIQILTRSDEESDPRVKKSAKSAKIGTVLGCITRKGKSKIEIALLPLQLEIVFHGSRNKQ